MKKISHISMQTKLALIVTIVLWSSAFVGIRTSLEGYGPGPLALFRFAIASLCLGLMCFYLPKRNSITLKDKLGMLLLGAITLGGYHVALNYGELSVSSGIASFIIAQSPVFTSILAVFFLKERLYFLGVCGMLVSVAGVTLILLGHGDHIHFYIGNFYVLTAALLGSVYNVLQKKFLEKYHAVEVTAYVVWGTTLILLIFTLPLMHEIQRASWTATLSVVYLGVFPAAIAYLAWSYVLTGMPASRAINFFYAMPLITTFLGWIFLAEVPPLLSLVGGLIALVGVWLVNVSYKKISRPVMIQEQAMTDVEVVEAI